MDERLSDMVDAALRWHSQRARPSPKDVERCWPALAEMLADIGIFARDMERTEALHADEPARQVIERAQAGTRLYGRLLDPPHGDNVVNLKKPGINRFAVLESRRS
jgi:hypothetical protein